MLQCLLHYKEVTTMKNKKGFTIVELGVSICLVTIVSFLLFQMITTVKKLYASGDVKTTLLTKQAIMTKKIYDEFDTKIISQITSCDEWQISCLTFVFMDGSSSTLSVDPLKYTISYNNYSINYADIDDTISFGALVFNKNSDFFTIKIPITSKTVKGNYDISVTKQHTNYITNSYSETYSSITIPLSDTDGNSTTTTITYEDGNYWMRVYDSEANPNLDTLLTPYFKYFKLDACTDTTLAGNVYEFRTGTLSSQWCQTNNLYTQTAGGYQFVSGGISTALGKDTYKEALTTTSTLASTTLDLKVNNFVDRYTFKSR